MLVKKATDYQQSLYWHSWYAHWMKWPIFSHVSEYILSTQSFVFNRRWFEEFWYLGQEQFPGKEKECAIVKYIDWPRWPV